MGLKDFTLDELMNKIFRTSNGGTVDANSGTAQERLAAAIDTTNNRLNVQLANQIQVFSHTFKDDIGTTSHYLSWTDEIEGSAVDYRTHLAVPYDMTLVKMIVRTRSITTGFTLTATIGKIADAQAVSGGNLVDVATANKSWLGTSDNEQRTYLAADFTATPTIPKNHLGSIKIKANVDPHGSSSQWFITSVWSFDLNS